MSYKPRIDLVIKRGRTTKVTLEHGRIILTAPFWRSLVGMTLAALEADGWKVVSRYSYSVRD